MSEYDPGYDWRLAANQRKGQKRTSENGTSSTKSSDKKTSGEKSRTVDRRVVAPNSRVYSA